MTKVGRPGTRVDRVAQILAQHRISGKTHDCHCGVHIESSFEADQHKAMAIVWELYGIKPTEFKAAPKPHLGSPYEIQMHRLKKELLCRNCEAFMAAEINFQGEAHG